MKIIPPDFERIRQPSNLRQAQLYLGTLAEARHLLLHLACLHDNIPLDDMARQPFSNDNPWLPKLNRVHSLLWKARGEYQTGGYQKIIIEPVEVPE